MNGRGLNGSNGGARKRVGFTVLSARNLRRAAFSAFETPPFARFGALAREGIEAIHHELVGSE